MGSTGDTGAGGGGTGAARPGAARSGAERLMRREMAEQPASVAALAERRAPVRLIGPVEGGRPSWSAATPETLALALGHDPDSPRGLTKITLT